MSLHHPLSTYPIHHLSPLPPALLQQNARGAAMQGLSSVHFETVSRCISYAARRKRPRDPVSSYLGGCENARESSQV